MVTAGVWTAGCTAFGGKRESMRYAAVRVGAFADKQPVGIRGKFTRGVQHFTQPDGYGAARLRRRLVLRWSSL